MIGDAVKRAMTRGIERRVAVKMGWYVSLDVLQGYLLDRSLRPARSQYTCIRLLYQLLCGAAWPMLAGLPTRS